MASANELTADERIQRDVLDELHFDPGVRPTEVGLELSDGIATLTGTVDSYHKKWRAAEAALRVYGVRAVANELVVELPSETAMNDTDLARAVATALEHSAEVPLNAVKVNVEQGRVLLEGTVAWHSQRQAAHRIVRQMKGVKEVSDLIEVRPRDGTFAKPEEIKLQIERALTRSAQLHAHSIHVSVHESTVTLRGHVRSFVEREEAGRAAWSLLGVTRVHNELEVWP